MCLAVAQPRCGAREVRRLEGVPAVPQDAARIDGHILTLGIRFRLNLHRSEGVQQPVQFRPS